ncbi:hypothetical protein N7495_009485 [Penicillium taxi]|uniref:uncharacterized protein n=1 Tax=Penicillium taxi TaxID=168475 RepID=UPI002544E219|nr:uncharacterized protein N7495_009485 [Penicillium taxi]KAJ5884975.1 hypothetical protein N7495_009485 [Penicillium taxi]
MPIPPLTLAQILAHAEQIQSLRKCNRRGARDPSIQLFPTYPHASNYYARVKLMLNRPFRSEAELLDVNGHQFSTHTDAYQYCLANHQHPRDANGETFQPEEPDQSLDDEPIEYMLLLFRRLSCLAVVQL